MYANLRFIFALKYLAQYKKEDGVSKLKTMKITSAIFLYVRTKKVTLTCASGLFGMENGGLFQISL